MIRTCPFWCRSKNSIRRRSGRPRPRSLIGALWRAIARWSGSRRRPRRYSFRSTKPARSVGRAWSRLPGVAPLSYRTNSDHSSTETRRAVRGRLPTGISAAMCAPNLPSHGLWSKSIRPIVGMWKLFGQCNLKTWNRATSKRASARPGFLRQTSETSLPTYWVCPAPT